MNLDQAVQDIAASCAAAPEFQAVGDTPAPVPPAHPFLSFLIGLFGKFLGGGCPLFGIAAGDTSKQATEKNFNAATGEYHPDFLQTATGHTMRANRIWVKHQNKHHGGHEVRQTPEQAQRTTIETLDKGRLGDESDVAGIVSEASQVDLSELA